MWDNIELLINNKNDEYKINNFSYNKNLHKSIGLYCIKIDDILYIGETINISRRLHEHMKDLKNHQHSNKILQSAYNKYNDMNYVYCYVLYKYSNKALRFNKKIVEDYSYNEEDIDIQDYINNLYKLVLVSLENYTIRYFIKKDKYLVCNKEKTVNKIYYNLDNIYKQDFIDIYNIIINRFNELNSFENYELKHTKRFLIIYYIDRSTIRKICDKIYNNDKLNKILINNNIFLLQRDCSHGDKFYFY